MNRFAARATVLAAAATLVGGAWAGNGAAAPVGPNQRFLGVVNGNHTGAVVYVICPGPARPGETGGVVGGQSLATILLPTGSAAGGGFTGSAATRIVARFADDPSVPVRFFTYGVAKAIPRDLRVPCDGQGRVTFTPAPGSPTATRDTVTVSYENLAV